MSINETATQVLDAYLDADKLAVPHAVLITGRWGSGKTYFLQNVYEPLRAKRIEAAGGSHTPFLFVSLFGANSAKDVEMRIYKTACPGEAVAGGIAGTLALGIGEFFRVKDTAKVLMEQISESATKKLREFVFVFDDLERVEKSAFGEVMGLVNSFVAEHGRRVLLVTDEDKLVDLVGGDTWKDQNEKIVGRRARVKADVESVVKASVDAITDGPIKCFMSDSVNDLIEVARTSEIENLRNLSWAMHNATAFVECLLSDGEIEAPHITWTIKVVLATTLWLRSGKLDVDTLDALPGLSMTMAFRSVARDDKDVPLDDKTAKAKAFSDCFASLNVDSPPVDYGFVSGFERSGVLDRSEVNTWIKSMFGFGKDHIEPSWRQLWYSRDRPMEATERAVLQLKDELVRRAYTSRGPILHAAGLALRHWDVGDTRLTDGEDVVTFFRRYVDEVANQGFLEKSTSDPIHRSMDGYGGLGFDYNENPAFDEIRLHVQKRSEEAAARELGERVEAIVQEFEDGDVDALFKLNRTDDYDLASSPVMLDVEPERLATLMARDRPYFTNGAKFLAYRYHRFSKGEPLFEEIRWARAVYNAAVEKIDHWPDMHRTMALESSKGLIRHYENGRPSDDQILPREDQKEDEKID